MDYKKKKAGSNASYEKLKAALKSGELGRCYIFHGPEQYLLKDSLVRMRNLLCSGNLDSFSYKRFDAGSFSAEVLEEAAEVLPLFSGRNLIEVYDYDLFKSDERELICEIIAGLPDHVCVVFIYTALEYSPDKRFKTTGKILKCAEVVEFAIQEENKLVDWIKLHFSKIGKNINSADARYLAQITGGLMTALHGEIRKTAAYAKGQHVTRGDIDAVVIPVLDTVAYRLTDAIIKREHKNALQLLDNLLQMREAPHKLIYSISLKMRQLLAARVCIDNKTGRSEFMKMCGIYSDYAADVLMKTAGKTTLAYCKNAVLMCSQTAKELNSTNEPEARLIELVANLALVKPQ